LIGDQNFRQMVKGISIDDIKAGSRAFIQNEHRAYIYANAVNQVQNNFNDISKITKGISNLLSGWHNSFYRFGPFNDTEISKCVALYHNRLKVIRRENILDVIVDNRFESQIRTVYYGFLDATASVNVKFTRKTITGTSKALSLLAPDLFPMCDEKISQAYNCWWVYSDGSFNDYLTFLNYMKILAVQLVSEYSEIHRLTDRNKAETLLIKEIKVYSGDSYNYDKTLLKIIDEYNYSKHTKSWI